MWLERYQEIQFNLSLNLFFNLFASVQAFLEQQFSLCNNFQTISPYLSLYIYIWAIILSFLQLSKYYIGGFFELLIRFIPKNEQEYHFVLRNKLVTRLLRYWGMLKKPNLLFQGTGNVIKLWICLTVQNSFLFFVLLMDH